MSDSLSRRDFLKAAGAAAIGLGIERAEAKKSRRPPKEIKLPALEIRQPLTPELEDALAKLRHFGLKPEDLAIVIDPGDQVLYLIQNQEIVKAYTISTARKGLGTGKNDERTPTGAHRIVGKLGGDTAKGKQVRVDRRTMRNMTTRVLPLTGLEPGVNRDGDQDSYRRGIAIHGTPFESRIGRPASHGCIRLSDDDIIDLFNLISPKTRPLVEILNKQPRAPKRTKVAANF